MTNKPQKTNGAAGGRKQRCARGPLARGYAWLAMALMSIVGTSATTGQTLQYRDPASAPPSWVQFAKLVKYRFEEWIAADEPVAARFRTYVKAHSGTSDGPPPVLTVRAWVRPDGSMDRVTFAAFSDRDATEDLRTILTRGNVGEPPPPDMLQPLNLRFSLNVKAKDDTPR
ncbi:hypothetical protein [Pseudolabrys taiwanensis]|nr:hypothetical protein [Pseudolabrys taiwanensis]